MSGLKRHKGDRLRFMTLTTPVKPKRKLSEAFDILKKRVKRVSTYQLIRDGYVGWGSWRRYYKQQKKGLRFDYLKVESRERQSGVYHVLYFGDFIPQSWLSEQWDEIIGAKVVDIRATRGRVKDAKKLSRYCITQYCAGQSDYVRCSWSQGWVFKGFVRIWKWIIEEFGVRGGIKVWNGMMRGERRVYEHNNRGYSIGLDKPYIRVGMCGEWVNALWGDEYKIFHQ